MVRLSVFAKLNDTSDWLNISGTQRLLQRVLMQVFIGSYIDDSEAVLIADALKQRKYKEIDLSSTLTLSFVFSSFGIPRQQNRI